MDRIGSSFTLPLSPKNVVAGMRAYKEIKTLNDFFAKSCKLKFLILIKYFYKKVGKGYLAAKIIFVGL